MTQQNVNTAAKESKESSLKTSHILDLFYYVEEVSACQAQPQSFTPPAGAGELTAFDEEGPDYYSVWLADGWPVAIAAPMDGFFRVLAGEAA